MRARRDGVLVGKDESAMFLQFSLCRIGEFIPGGPPALLESCEAGRLERLTVQRLTAFPPIEPELSLFVKFGRTIPALPLESKHSGGPGWLISGRSSTVGHVPEGVGGIHG